jgi:hypothetical protein
VNTGGIGRGDVRGGALGVLMVDLGLLGVRRGFGRLSVLFRSNSAELPTLTVLPTPFSQITYCKSAVFLAGADYSGRQGTDEEEMSSRSGGRRRAEGKVDEAHIDLIPIQALDALRNSEARTE